MRKVAENGCAKGLMISSLVQLDQWCLVLRILPLILNRVVTSLQNGPWMRQQSHQCTNGQVWIYNVTAVYIASPSPNVRHLSGLQRDV